MLSHGQESGALHVFDLSRIREQLAELGLDWGAPARARQTNPALAPRLRVELIDAGWAGSAAKMAEFENRNAVTRLSVNPRDAEAHLRLGVLLVAAAKNAQAHSHLSTALTLRRDLDEALYLRAVAAFALKNWADAEADASGCLRQRPLHHDARFLHARACLLLKQYEKAAADCTELLKAYPALPRAYEVRALCHAALGKSAAAAADRERALAHGGNNPSILNNHAWYLLTGPVKERNPVKALRLVRQALKQQPGNPVLLNTLGVAEYRNGQYKEALVTLQKSLAAGKGQSDAFDLFFLAMCHARLRDGAKAKDCFNRAVRWCVDHKGLPAEQEAELRSFRAEAGSLLRSP
jgi:tetratricopeptide (TPR) repeat protein